MKLNDAYPGWWWKLPAMAFVAFVVILAIIPLMLWSYLTEGFDAD